MTLLNRITNFIDEATKIACVFLFCFIWALYIKKELFPALVLTVITSLVTLSLLHIISTNKKQKDKQKKVKQTSYLSFCNKLKLSPQTDRLNFFALLFPTFKIADNYLINDNEVICPCLKENLSLDEIFSICSLVTNKEKLNIICLSYSKDVELTARKITPLKVSLTPLKEIFSLNIEKAENFESTLKVSNEKLYNFKLLLVCAFTKDKAKKYLLLCAALTLSLFFLPYKLLYALLATLALACAILCKTNLIK